MEFSGHVEANPATPEYVLSVIVDQHRQLCQFDPEVDPDAHISFETTVNDWRLACDLISWKPLGRALNMEWDLSYTDAQWNEVLNPPQSRTLRDVCEFISRQAIAKKVVPANILGRKCLSAGAFLAICSCLSHAGADVSEIAPSTPLHEYTRKHGKVFLTSISMLAPGAMPKVKVHENAGYAICMATFPLALMGAPIAYFLLRKVVPCMGYIAVLCFLLGIISYAATWLFAKRPPRSVEFGDLQTFADLAKVVAAQCSDVPEQSRAT